MLFFSSGAPDAADDAICNRLFVTRVAEQKERQSKEHSHKDRDGAGIVVSANRVEGSPAREWGGRAKSGYQVEKYRQKESKNANEPTMSLLREVSRYVATNPGGMVVMPGFYLT